MGSRATGYGGRSVELDTKLIIEFSSREIAAIEGWGAPAGMASRSEAVRRLIEKGLQAISNNAEGRRA